MDLIECMIQRLGYLSFLKIKLDSASTVEDADKINALFGMNEEKLLENSMNSLVQTRNRLVKMKESNGTTGLLIVNIDDLIAYIEDLIIRKESRGL